MKLNYSYIRTGARTGLVLLTAAMVPTGMQAQAHTPLIDPIPATIPSSGITVTLEPVMSGLV